jgi:hypothetical protein
VSDQIEVLKLVTGRLDAAGIGYMVTGSLALSHYAQPRMTRDIDLVVALEPTTLSGWRTCSGINLIVTLAQCARRSSDRVCSI